MKTSRIISTGVALLALAVLAALVLYVAIPKQPARPVPPELANILLPEAREIGDFSLTDIDGHAFNRDSLQGKWSFIFFGYTHCPDICPTTLGILKGSATQLQQGGNFNDIQFVFISVDPKRDSPAHLKDYIRYFHPDFSAATGEKAQIDTLARQLGAMYMFDGDTSGEDYIVNHSATIVLVDPQGRWVARFNPPHKSSAIAGDFRRVRAFLSNH